MIFNEPILSFTVLLIIGLTLIVLGFIIVIVSLIRRAGEAKESAAGGVVIIGPIPIVFGTSIKITKIVLILAIVLTVLALLLTIISLRVSL